MGSFADLKLSRYLVWSTKSYADPEPLTIFEERDRFLLASPANTGIDQFGYRATAGVVRDRLDAMGFTLTASRQYFAEASAARRAEIAEEAWRSQADERELSVLLRLTFDEWLAAFNVLRTNNIQRWNRTSQTVRARVFADDPLLFAYMLEDDGIHFHGFPVGDIRYFLRAATETLRPNQIITYDLSEVLHGRYYSQDERVADNARNSLLVDFPTNAPVVILTEGSSDRTVLQAALNVLAPHLSSYFTFFDFAAAAARGGASALVETVKAFIAARIGNRVIALFDNDTAAAMSLRALNAVELPANIRIRQLPPLDFATVYPTLGPSGPANLDVNGLAGSIELYFGTDVLRQRDGSFTPVQWHGYEAALVRYQGELQNKRELHSRFQAKVQRVLRNRRTMAKQDWSGMLAVLQVIRTAFKDDIVSAA